MDQPFVPTIVRLTPAQAKALAAEGLRARREIEARYAAMKRAAWAMA